MALLIYRNDAACNWDSMNKEKYEVLQFLFVVDKCTLHTYLVPTTYAKKKVPQTVQTIRVCFVVKGCHSQ